MISRRRFLEVGGVSAGALASQSLALPAPTEETPSAIARLKPRKAEAQPISREEREHRQERARQLMIDNRLDAIVLMEGTSLRYFTGIGWWGGERMFAMLLPAKEKPFYICPAFEEDRARQQMTNAPDTGDPDVRVWQEDESPYQLLAQSLKERGLANGRIGMEETIHFVFVDGISQASPHATIASATPVTAGLPHD